MSRSIRTLLSKTPAYCDALRPLPRHLRTFTSSPSRRQDEQSASPSMPSSTTTTATEQSSQEPSSSVVSTPQDRRRLMTTAKDMNMGILQGINNDIYANRTSSTGPSASSSSSSSNPFAVTNGMLDGIRGLASLNDPPYFLHCYATKHNTHVTLTRPDRSPLISISCGNLGFRKHRRGTYEAAFQTSAWVMRRMAERGCFVEGEKNYVTKMEVVMRGFAEGRQAFVQALMGIEGRLLRPKVVRVSDGTRVAIGGPRRPNPRRLG